MADVEHKNIGNANLHEPKDVSGATSGQVYVADGGGSGSWTTQSNIIALQVLVTTSVGAGTVGYATSPIAGTVTDIFSIVQEAHGSAVTYQAKINGTNITNGAMIATTGNVGEIVNTTPSGSNTLAIGDRVQVDIPTTGGSIGEVSFTFAVTPT